MSSARTDQSADEWAASAQDAVILQAVGRIAGGVYVGGLGLQPDALGGYPLPPDADRPATLEAADAGDGGETDRSHLDDQGTADVGSSSVCRQQLRGRLPQNPKMEFYCFEWNTLESKNGATVASNPNLEYAYRETRNALYYSRSKVYFKPY